MVLAIARHHGVLPHFPARSNHPAPGTVRCVESTRHILRIRAILAGDQTLFCSFGLQGGIVARYRRNMGMDTPI